MAITPTVAAIIAAGGVERYAVAEGIDPGAMCRAVHRLRAVYDFEFWCISCVKIFDKTSGRLVPYGNTVVVRLTSGKEIVEFRDEVIIYN